MVFNLIKMFDNFIIFQIIQKMGRKIIQNKENVDRSHVNRGDEEIFHQNQDDSTSRNILQAKEKLIQNIGKIKKKDSKMKKQRKKRVFQPQCRFQELHKKRFYLFPFYFATIYPFFKISWQSWKPNKYFVKMAKFLKNFGQELSSKTTTQCKSFDERQKKMVYNNNDLLEAAYLFLEDSNIDEQARQILQNFLRTTECKSDYMNFIERNGEADKERTSQAVSRRQQCEQCVDRQLTIQSSQLNQDANGVFNEFLDLESDEENSAKV